MASFGSCALALPDATFPNATHLTKPAIVALLPTMGGGGRALADPRSLSRRPERAWRSVENWISPNASSAAPWWWLKGSLHVGKTKRGKGTKLMPVADDSGLPLAVHAASASPHEVTLVSETLAGSFLDARIERLIGDWAYDSDPLDAELREEGVEMIAPHRRNRNKPRTQNRRKLRRYKRRWKIERLFAWLGNFRRLMVRYEQRAENYLGFVYFGSIAILLRYL
jgi:transposase